MHSEYRKNAEPGLFVSIGCFDKVEHSIVTPAYRLFISIRVHQNLQRRFWTAG